MIYYLHLYYVLLLIKSYNYDKMLVYLYNTRGDFEMFKINLSIYKESKQYFQLFDILLKDLDINKEAFLKDVGISPSSYRKARTIEQNIGDKIIEQLCNALKYKKATIDFISELEQLFNRVYFNMYYKIFKFFDKDLEIIDSLINQNYIVKPILILLKLFLLANEKKDVWEYKRDNIELYNDLKRYLIFFNEDLLEIMDILALVFEEDIPEEIMMKTYKNSLAYYSLSSRLCDDRRFVESLFIAKKAEDVLVRERNYKRLLYLNVKMMFCLNSIHSYQECFDLASMQLLTLQSFVDTEFEYSYTIKHLAICSTALKKYKYVSELISEQKNISLAELTCLLVAKFNISEVEYEKFYNFYFNKMSFTDKENLNILNNYLKNNDKKGLNKLEFGILTEIIISALKRTQIS